ncbi:MAG: type I restriction enzyme HsdR N-terminal domain-containing protein [Candidatus Poribacteria bacterium]|nr:type I restriction enzyme HsdR N-terminal domain-containing protein [Candidatus Poribacteria bacterium]
MTDLRNTIAHILEHKQHLAEANEATIQQYVVLPILRTLGWDDTNLASMEIIPEYKVESRRADYALHTKRNQNPVVLIECKRWDQPIGKNEEQICFYAYSGNVPLAIITNGKLWRFYLSRWEASSLSDRIFCETDIDEDREGSVTNLEKYFLKSNVISGEAELNAEIALEEKGKTSTSEISPIAPNSNSTDDAIDSLSEERPITTLPESDVEWTREMVRNSLSEELIDFFKKRYTEENLKLFYGGVADIQNLINKEGWGLNPPKFSKMLVAFG